MVRMRALQHWRGQEGRVVPGDIVEVDEARARQLEGYVTNTGRRLSPTEGEGMTQAETIKAPPRAERLRNDPPTNTKGGPTAGARNGTHDRDQTQPPQPDATHGARIVADAHGVSLHGVAGTGKDGRVTRADVVALYGEPPAEE